MTPSLLRRIGNACRSTAVIVALANGMTLAGIAQAAEDPIARIGNVSLGSDDIRDYIRALDANERAALKRDPALLSQAVRNMLAREMVLRESAAQKWDQQPAVARQLERIRENALVESYLQSKSEPAADFPSAADVQAIYDANKNILTVPRQFQLTQVFIAAPKGADKATEDNARKELEALQKKLSPKPADVSAVAQWTELGWLQENQIAPPIRERIATLSKGAMTEPVRLDDGWHIVRVVDTKASYTRSLDEVRPQLVAKIRSERATANRQAYLTKLLEQNPPAVNELALTKLLTETDSTAQAK